MFKQYKKTPVTIPDSEVQWLSGLLEGEGTFGYWMRSSGRKQPTLACGMTDEDVITRMAKLLGVAVVRCWSEAKRVTGRKPMFYAQIQGLPALGLMLTLFPFMGQRRRARIADVLTAWEHA